MSAEKILQALQLIRESQEELRQSIEYFLEEHSNLPEQITDIQANQIIMLQDDIDDLRDNIIRGEILSGKKSKDIAHEYNLSAARVSQIAPRNKEYN